MAKLHLHQARALPSLSPQPPHSVTPSHLQFGVFLVTDTVLTLVFIVQEPRGSWGLKSPWDCSEGEQLIGPHNVCDTASSRVSQGWDNLHHSLCGQGACGSSGNLEHLKMMLTGSIPASRCEQGRVSQDPFQYGNPLIHPRRLELEAWMGTSIRPHQLMPSWQR